MQGLISSRYRVIEKLGQGAFGETFLAEDIHLPSKRKCVIKKLIPIANPGQFELVKERFEREAAILEELGEHAAGRVPKLHAYFTETDQFYLVQEWVAGQTLTRTLQESGRFNETTVRRLVADLLDTLDYVHSKRIIHRDIKPDNIILRQSDGKPVLIDFGVVKEVVRLDSIGNPTSSILAGTPAFMAMEQAAGKPMYASDIYSLGMTAVCLLIGKPPSQVLDPLTGDVEWKPLVPSVTPEFARILDKAIEPHFKDRYKTAAAMAAEIQALDGSKTTAPISPVQSDFHTLPTRAETGSLDAVPTAPAVFAFAPPPVAAPPAASPQFAPPQVVTSPPRPIPQTAAQPSQQAKWNWKNIGTVVGILALLGGGSAGIAIPNLLAARRAANGATAIQTLRNINSAQATYQVSLGKGNFASDLSKLGGTAEDTLGFLDDTVTQAQKIPKSGYLLGPLVEHPATQIGGNPVVRASISKMPTYSIVNAPEVKEGFSRTGNDTFFVDETGVIRHSGSPNVAATSTSPPIGVD